MMARAIHQLSPRASHPLVAVHCAALSQTCWKASFSATKKAPSPARWRSASAGSSRPREGRCSWMKLAKLTPTVQVKLLRVLGERTFERVGSNKTLTADVRLIAATNKNLQEEVKTGKFRDDLFFRLRVVEITLPPLRQRPEDLPLLAKMFLREFASENNKNVNDFTPDALEALMNYAWPGNVRELRTAVDTPWSSRAATASACGICPRRCGRASRPPPPPAGQSSRT